MHLPLILLAIAGCWRGTGAAPEIDGDCGRRASEAGAASGVGVDSQTFDWTYDRDQDLSWGGPITYTLGDDIVSFAVTVDAGDTPSGVAWMANDGQSILDGSGHTALGDAVRSARSDLAADSWWDSWGADTGWTPQGDGWGGGPLYHWPGPAGTVRMPLNGDTAPSPGCLALLPVASGDLRGETGTVHLVTKRSAATADALNVNLIVMDGSGITEDEAWAAMDEMTRIYDAGGGPATGEVVMWLDAIGGGATTVPSSGAELNAIRARDYEGEMALNIFFIADFSGESGTLGIAAGIPGAMGVQGTAGSGVVISVDTHLDGGGQVDTALMGGTMAHELGHQLGLFHSTESDGQSHDIISDTPECGASYDTDNDGYVTAEECVGADGANFMFWTSGDVVQEDISPQQAAMLDASPPAQ